MFYASSGHSYLVQLPPEGNLFFTLQLVEVAWAEENEFFLFAKKYILDLQ